MKNRETFDFSNVKKYPFSRDPPSAKSCITYSISIFGTNVVISVHMYIDNYINYFMWIGGYRMDGLKARIESGVTVDLSSLPWYCGRDGCNLEGSCLLFAPFHKNGVLYDMNCHNLNYQPGFICECTEY